MAETKFCGCGNPEGTDPECERCRFIATAAKDSELLFEAMRQIIALNSELNNATGGEQTTNVVALMIEDRLDNGHPKPAPANTVTDIMGQPIDFSEKPQPDLIELTFAEKVESFIDDVFGGRHHVRKIEDKGHHVKLVIFDGIATYDGDTMTRIVIASHELGLRAELSANGMRGLKILLHNRVSRTGCPMYQRHPTLETVINKRKAL
jgi:hypothetical protein